VFRASGTDEGGGTMGRLSREGGFFVEAFGELPGPRLGKKPLNLGPRYRVDYRMSSTERVHQDLYPYAAGGPVTHMESAQRFWNEQRTKGGWFRAPELAEGQQTLTAALISAGLPATETTDSSTTNTLAAVFASRGPRRGGSFSRLGLRLCASLTGARVSAGHGGDASASGRFFFGGLRVRSPSCRGGGPTAWRYGHPNVPSPARRRRSRRANGR
jgi:hypothetical protein